MNFSKGMLYYFMFWTFYLPISIGISFIHQDLETFFIGLGIGALGLFVFLFGRLLYIKVKKKSSPQRASNLTNISETPLPNDSLIGFRNLFSEQTNSEGGKL